VTVSRFFFACNVSENQAKFPIQVSQIMAQSQTLYFLDIGMGNNVADITQVSVSGRVLASAADGSNLRTLVSHLTDLGGCVYRFDMEGKDKKVIWETDGAYTGIGLWY
jgi:hypothetical protein